MLDMPKKIRGMGGITATSTSVQAKNLHKKDMIKDEEEREPLISL